MGWTSNIVSIAGPTGRLFSAVVVAVALSIGAVIALGPGAAIAQQNSSGGGNEGGSEGRGEIETSTVDDGEGGDPNTFGRSGRIPEDEALDCPAGSYASQSGRACVSLITRGFVCPDDYQLRGERCLPTRGCPEGQVSNDGVCGDQPEPEDQACLAANGCIPGTTPRPEREPEPECPFGAAAVNGACVIQSCPSELELREIILAGGAPTQACCTVGTGRAPSCPPGYDQRRRCCVL